jgi:3-methyladenine DNA glycosylase Tag
MSWRVVEAKWPGITEAFKEFDAEAVAQFTESDVDAFGQRYTGDPQSSQARRHRA